MTQVSKSLEQMAQNHSVDDAVWSKESFIAGYLAAHEQKAASVNGIRVVGGIVYLLVTEKAKEIFQSGLFEVYKIHGNNSESLCKSYADINDALEVGLDIGIEVGAFEDIVKALVG